MLLIADSPREKPLKGWLSAAADITKPYPINQLPRYQAIVKSGGSGEQTRKFACSLRTGENLQ
jgi:hypothetical protein